MKYLLACLACAPFAFCAGVPSDAKTPATETFRYSINWPSGLALGEAAITASRGADGRTSLTFKAEAPMPGFPLIESAESQANAKGCSLELKKRATRGSRKIEEQTTFDQEKLTAVRETEKGGKTDLSISPCAKDALAYFFHVRRELAGGRLPPAEKIYYGAAYQVRVSFLGTEKIRIGDEWVEADRLSAALKGPASDLTIELLFARDTHRTPLMVRLPLAMGKFTLELIR